MNGTEQYINFWKSIIKKNPKKKETLINMYVDELITEINNIPIEAINKRKIINYINEIIAITREV